MALWYNYFRPSVYPYVAVQYRISIIKGVLLPQGIAQSFTLSPYWK